MIRALVIAAALAQPTARAEQPTARAEQPTARAEQPTVRAEQPTAEAPPPLAAQAPAYRVHAGVQVGFPFVLGVYARGTLFAGERPRFDVDLLWEPSPSLQSYSLGGAWHVLDRAFFIGARLRLVTYQPPWARGPVVPFFGLGPEVGVRLPVGPKDKGVISVALHGSFMPGQAANLATLIGLSAGFSWAVFER
jgi:hypothetical protein